MASFKKLTRGSKTYVVNIDNIAFMTEQDGATQISFCSQNHEGAFGGLAVSETPEQILDGEAT